MGRGRTPCLYNGQQRNLVVIWIRTVGILFPSGNVGPEGKEKPGLAWTNSSKWHFNNDLSLIIYLTGKGRERERDRSSAIPSGGALSKWPQQSLMGQTEPRSLELHSYVGGRVVNIYWAIFHCFSSNISKALNWKWKARMQTGAYVGHGICRQQLNLLRSLDPQNDIFCHREEIYLKREDRTVCFHYVYQLEVLNVSSPRIQEHIKVNPSFPLIDTKWI